MVTTARIDRDRSEVRRMLAVGLVVAFFAGSCSDGGSGDTSAEDAAAPVELEADAEVDSDDGDDSVTEPGDWQPSCTDPVADQMAWKRSWAQQPAFEAIQERDYHEHAEFDAILVEATVPLGQCTPEHVQQVRTLMQPTRRQAPETHARILVIFDEVIASILGAPAAPTEVTAVDGCRPPCTITGSINTTHPSWGALTLVVFGPQSGRAPTTTAGIVAIDSDGAVRWRYDYNDPSLPTYRFRLAGEGPYYGETSVGVDEPVDTMGRIFIDYDPGRYNGVIVLEPTVDGFEDFGTLPPAGDYLGRFYYAEATDADRDGRYEIRQYSESGPSLLVYWDGNDYRPIATQSDTTTTTAPITTTVPTTSSASSGENVSERFVSYWVAGDWSAMAGIAEPGAIAVAQEWYEAGGIGFGCPQAEIDRGFCEIGYAPGPTGIGLLFQATFSGTGSSARIESLVFAGDAG